MYNRVVLLGNLTRDPEYGVSEKGNAYCRIDIATNRRIGENEETFFCRCIAFGSTADYAGEYLQKGNRVFIEGRLRTDKYKKEDGTTVSKTAVVVERIINLSYKPAAGNTTTTKEENVEPTRRETPPADLEGDVETMLEEF